MAETLRELIREGSNKLMIKRLEGRLPAPGNPFKKAELSFDYSRLDSRYHASENPDDEIIVYKGAPSGKELEGHLSMALLKGIAEHVTEVKKLIESGDHELIEELFDAHTNYYNHTGLLSATFNPEMAQVFAPAGYAAKNRGNSTIYELKLRADRCVVDCYDTGDCGESKELLILGAVLPEEISAVKIVNDDSHSELRSVCGGTHIIRSGPDKESTNRDVKDVSNWSYL